MTKLTKAERKLFSENILKLAREYGVKVSEIRRRLKEIGKSRTYGTTPDEVILKAIGKK